MSHEEVRWYEQRWLEDRRRWEEEQRSLQQRLEEQAAEILELKRRVAECADEKLEKLQRQVDELQQRLKEEQAAHKQCAKALEQAKQQLATLARPPLGEGFFRYLGQNIGLWDQALMEEARKLEGWGIEQWLRAIWEEREGALSQVFAGEITDWQRVRTGLVLEWALLTWLEGVRDG